jgi:hypothetical protein
VDQDGDFIVAWHGPGVAFNAGGIFGQRFDSNGMLQAIEFRIDSYGTLGGGYASIAAHGDGDFVVTWNHGSQDGSVSGIFGQRFDQDAAKVGTDFQVNTVTLSHQNLPRVASDADGDFVVVFNGVDASNTGVLAQRFDSSGARIGGEFLVNTFFTAAQFGGDIGMAGDGTFVIAWQSQGNDGNNYGIFAQTFDSSGSPSGVEFQVNKYTPTSQVNPSAAMAADGDFVIAWMSPKPADTGDILAQRGGEPPVLVTGDIDGNTEVAPLVDGLLVLRHLFGFTNTSLVTGAIGPNCSRCDGPAITAYLTGLGLTLLDADGNGMKDPLTDGLLYLRYLFGFRNDALISNAVGLGCSRCTAMQIADYLDGLV